MDKEFLLNESKVFCMAPWVHLYATPVGEAFACCISKKQCGSSITTSVGDLINSNDMKQLRLDMLNERANDSCRTCYNHEKQGQPSFRKQFADRYGKYIEESLENTKPDGHLKNFKMRYYDIRFSNICNFKCRTCNSHFSSQWEQENIKRNLAYSRIPIKNNNPKLVKEVVEHIPYMDHAYFAGGEPLITEEHYILLEEMLRQGRTDIKLVYNSNASNLKFKNRDILDIWSKFNQTVEFAASIDHIEKRAEYMRHGTEWVDIDTNLRVLKTAKNVKLLVNSVVCNLNYVTIDTLYDYLIESGIYEPGTAYHLYPLISPEIFHAQALPAELKAIGKERLFALADRMDKKGFWSYQTDNLRNLPNWVDAENSWETYKEEFRKEIKVIDEVRGENFVETFPELKSLFE